MDGLQRFLLLCFFSNKQIITNTLNRFLQFGSIGHIGKVFHSQISCGVVDRSVYHTRFILYDTLRTARTRSTSHAQNRKGVFYRWNTIPQVFNSRNGFTNCFSIFNGNGCSAVVDFYFLGFNTINLCQSFLND